MEILGEDLTGMSAMEILGWGVDWYESNGNTGGGVDRYECYEFFKAETVIFNLFMHLSMNQHMSTNIL